MLDLFLKMGGERDGKDVKVRKGKQALLFSADFFCPGFPLSTGMVSCPRWFSAVVSVSHTMPPWCVVVMVFAGVTFLIEEHVPQVTASGAPTDQHLIPKFDLPAV